MDDEAIPESPAHRADTPQSPFIKILAVPAHCPCAIDKHWTSRQAL